MSVVDVSLKKKALGGYLQQRRRKSTALTAPQLANFELLLQSSGEREISTTMSFVFFFKQKTAYEISVRDWSSDVCSSDLPIKVRKRLPSGKIMFARLFEAVFIPSDS